MDKSLEIICKDTLLNLWKKYRQDYPFLSKIWLSQRRSKRITGTSVAYYDAMTGSITVYIDRLCRAFSRRDLVGYCHLRHYDTLRELCERVLLHEIAHAKQDKEGRLKDATASHAEIEQEADIWAITAMKEEEALVAA